MNRVSPSNWPGAHRKSDRNEAVPTDRSVSPVVGIILIVAVTIMLASVVAVMALSFDDHLTSPDWRTGTENPWAEDPLVGPENPVAGAEDVRYHIYFEISENVSTAPLNSLTITVDDMDDDMFSGTTDSDLETFEIIRPDGNVTSLDDVHNWDAEPDELTIHVPEDQLFLEDGGDIVEIVFGGVDNPGTAGTYDVSVFLQGGISQQEGELEIVPG